MPGRRCPACDSSTTIELVRARVRDTYLRLSSSAPMDESLIVSELVGAPDSEQLSQYAPVDMRFIASELKGARGGELGRVRARIT